MKVNFLENNFRFYKVIPKGKIIDCYYNGQMLLSHTDYTFPDVGLVGSWSKADACSLFDDLKITMLKELRLQECNDRLKLVQPFNK